MRSDDEQVSPKGVATFEIKDDIDVSHQAQLEQGRLGDVCTIVCFSCAIHCLS